MAQRMLPFALTLVGYKLCSLLSLISTWVAFEWSVESIEAIS